MYPALFIFPPLLLLLLELQANGKIGILTADAELYLSIADNFVQNGHFIQTARPVAGFVVPPGVPFVLTLMRLAGFTLPMITAVHGILFGTDCILLYQTARGLFGRCGICAPLIFALAYLRCRLYLGNIFVEHWYLFLLCLLVRLLIRKIGEKKKALLLVLCSLTAWMTRPVLLPVYLAAMGHLIRVSRRCRSARPFLAAALVSVLVLAGNLAVNFRETGEWILLQNYSGLDFYKAFHPDAAVTRAQNMDFRDPVLDSICSDSSLSMTQKTQRLMAMAKEFVREDPAGILAKMAKRGYELYGRCFFFAPAAALAGGLAFCRNRKREEGVLPLTVNLILAAASCAGIPELRYTMPVWPLAAIHIPALFSLFRRSPVPEHNSAEDRSGTG